ncbi:ChbG/HpnK family deacetylase [Microvirga terricola]|uniref:ChbG/HpnK family deacetylase n=1 Tax=Microvirga terricola TaxID=2719797 RepID=A0ABX0VAI8_9HYPH|nr:ChbG/HpnK family deacetylase [Microvirga terricola]NIX76862.1 ChbG/HpnK family deacetylase [Microvirga terricola]
MVLPRSAVLCADDFGLSDGVSQGILELAEAGRLSATGAMTNMPGWRRNAPALTAVRGRIGIGLHLNLTTGSPLAPMPYLAPGGGFPALKDLLVKAVAGRLPAAEVRGEIARQLDAFTEAHGELPSFVDGHQHVHVLPVIRSALLRVLEEKGYGGRLWVRDPSDRVSAILQRPIGRAKALVVKGLASGFARRARAAGFWTNDGFSGFSPLDLSVSAQSVFESGFADLGTMPLIMCHPGYVDEELRRLDPAVESRPVELAYLKSEAFGALLEEREIRLVPGPT